LAQALRAAALLEGDFTLRSGRKSKYYLDKYLFETQPVLLRELGKRFARHVTSDVDRIAGAELGAIALAAATALETGKPFVIVRNAKKAGYENGQGFPELTLLLVESALNHSLGDFLQAEWKKHLGITIKLEFTDSKTRSARFNAQDYQLVTGGWQEDYPDPENWFLGLWETNGSINKTGTSIKALDDLVGKAKFNQNDEERRRQYRDAEKLLLEQASGIAPLWHTQAKFLVKPHIKGMIEHKRPGDTFVPGGWDP
jgi:ABC-type oligopeptide transport system substrate-binding subunit